jgi:transcriptional regulator with XRE-family HTH domain
MATETARWIASHRDERGQNQAEFARSVGVSLRTIQNWEAGATEPTGRNRRLLISYIGEEPPGTPMSTAAELAALRDAITRLEQAFRDLAEAREDRYDALVAGQGDLVAAVERAVREFQAAPSAPATAGKPPAPNRRRQAS